MAEERIKELDFMLERSVFAGNLRGGMKRRGETAQGLEGREGGTPAQLRAMIPAPGRSELASKIETAEGWRLGSTTSSYGLPFTARTETEIRLVAALRNLVLDIVVDARPHEKCYRLSVRTSLAGIANDLHGLREKLPVVSLKLGGTVARGQGRLALPKSSPGSPNWRNEPLRNDRCRLGTAGAGVRWIPVCRRVQPPPVRRGAVLSPNGRDAD